MAYIEPLENRIAPAGGSGIYTEPDGDTVKVTFSKGTSDLLTAAVVNGHLDSLTIGDGLAGTNITVEVTALGATGDGLADVGFINSSVALGKVLIKGNLGNVVDVHTSDEIEDLADTFN